MRSYVIVLIFLAALLLICIIRTYNSSKKIALTVRKLLLFILVPVISNIIIVITQSYTVSMAAYSCYLIGTDIMLYILIEFCMEYCSYKFKHSIVQFALKLFVVLDTISYQSLLVLLYVSLSILHKFWLIGFSSLFYC